MRIAIKALSVNKAWKGRRFRSNYYKQYQRELSLKLKAMEIPEGELWLTFEIGYSSRGADIDNFLKPCIDILSEYYGFNDNRVYVLHVKKTIVKKGDEFIDFNFKEISKG